MSIHKAMVAVMLDIGAIGKDKINQQQRFNFRGIDDVYNRLHNIMARHGVFTTSEILDEKRTERPSKNGGVLTFVAIKMRYHFWCGEDGSSVATEVIGEGMDSGDKATNKAMAIAHKYALLQAFLVPTEDMIDPDHDSPDPAIAFITADQVAHLRERLAETGGDEAKFLRYLKLNRLDDIPAANFSSCLATINSAAEKRGSNGTA